MSKCEVCPGNLWSGVWDTNTESPGFMFQNTCFLRIPSSPRLPTYSLHLHSPFFFSFLSSLLSSPFFLISLYPFPILFLSSFLTAHFFLLPFFSLFYLTHFYLPSLSLPRFIPFRFMVFVLEWMSLKEGENNVPVSLLLEFTGGSGLRTDASRGLGSVCSVTRVSCMQTCIA